jgi:hypothetical protein
VAVLTFALWTLCCHAVVAGGGSLGHAMSLFALVAVGSAGALLWARRRREPQTNESRSETPTKPGPSPSRHQWIARIAGLAMAAALAVTTTSLDEGWLWGGALACLGLGAAVFWAAEPPHVEPPLRGRGAEAALWGMAIGCVVIALITHRPDWDDTFYVNVAVAAADFPTRPLLAGDTLLGLDGLPLYLAAHRIHTYELANAALSWLTGIPAIYAFHWVSAALGAALVPLAFAVLFRLLAPREWPWAVLALLVVLVAAGETHRWYGNLALVRMWQGKAIYLFVFTPLVYAAAIRFSLGPGWRRWGWLAAAQIAAVGCSSSAVWAAPAAAWLAMVAALRPNAEGLRRFGWGALTSVYPLAAGLLLRGDMQSALDTMLGDPTEALSVIFVTVLGDGRLYVFALASVLAAWALCPRGLGQRFAIIVPLGVWVVLLDPYTRDWIAANLTGPSYWRTLWSLPVPVLMALALIAPVRFHATTGQRVAGATACVAALVGFALAIPKFSALSSQNGGAEKVGIRVGKPGLKVPEREYRWAALLNEVAPERSIVLAPPRVSAWVPTFHGHAYPLLARHMYMKFRGEHLDIRSRIALTAYVGGVEHGDDFGEDFRKALDHFDVRAVCLRNAATADQAREALVQAGFTRQVTSPSFQIWVR